MVRVAEADPENRETDDGLRLYVAFTMVGFDETFRLTLPAKPFRLARDMTKVASWPCGTVRAPGFDPKVKSGEFDP